MQKALIITIFLLLSSCLSQIDKRGYSFELSDHQLVRESISDKNFVTDSMGYPTFSIDDENGELWVYFSEDVERFLFFKPNILKRDMMVLSFDNKGIVKKIDHYDLNNENKIQFASNYTEVESQKKGVFSQIFSNIGKVRPN